ncbi:MAG: D-sedoheptulose 7-phosphate isomerase [Flavobacteriales bacterium]|nr:D-sedoheptulose 7-phosphate isomerase [Flavobacteriales bacterium]MBK6753911.1 D-sedoheptulose 7-phosphate isomerase [Flavobacteriales bacterium]MBK7751718.1 D-sedoheptulose 7-phosphate isomerase [Flavobacteriales bacterium]MBK9076454.1 D-sedoheptulose 7-phosphate isomerase [Flavobacteriales bacterium]MBK9539512.1 D-sedoheptulose 7-phosphate isomerase [Flavobacteriales bacterium]
MSNDRIRSHFTEAADVLQRFLTDQENIANVERAAAFISYCLKQGAKVISCGNGGSMCDAMHFAEELTGRFRNDRPPIAAISISDPGHITCVGNDHGFDQVFSRFVEAHGREGDVLLAISTSGNSPNVLRAAEMARARQMHVIGLTGKDGGALSPLCTVEVRVPHYGFADRVQEVHIKVIHALIDHIEQELA